MPVETVAPVVEKDPWLDDEFSQPYSDTNGSSLMDDLANIEHDEAAVLVPETVTNIPPTTTDNTKGVPNVQETVSPPGPLDPTGL